MLDPENVSVYKQLYRAAKAKLKLRLKVTVINKEPITPKPATVEDEEPNPVSPVTETRPLIEPIVVSSIPASQVNSTMEAATEKPTHSNSVADIQQKFEELLINNPRSPPQAASAVLPCCSSYKPHSPAIPQHTDAPKMAFDSNTEVPVTQGIAARDRWFKELASLSNERQLCTRNSLTFPPTATESIFSVYCNNCSGPIPDVHYHCSTCDDGDFDLCTSCINRGVLCGGEGHWMIKRYVKSGTVINSTTERIAPKSAAKPKAATVPPAVQEDLQVTVATRTCNSCIQGRTAF